MLLAVSTMRQRALQHALGVGIGLSLGSVVMLRQQSRIRLDSRAVPRLGEPAVTRKERLDPELIRQISGGSVSGSSARFRSFRE